jgi:hypothetical protein
VIKPETYKKSEVCAYKECCYLAEALECYGYKTYCVLYLKSNNRFYTSKSFDEAVDRLINKTKAKYLKLNTGDKPATSTRGKIVKQ